MKIYSVVVSLVAILAIAGAGFFYWQYTQVNEKLNSVEQERKELQGQKDKAMDQVSNLQKGMKNIKETAEAFKAVIDSFIVSGNVKVEAIGPDEATAARQQIGDITDNTDKIAAEKTWDDFRDLKQVADLKALLENLANNLMRNIANATPK